MAKIRVVGCDPAFANMGLAVMTLDTVSMAMTVEDLILVQTTKATGKQVRANSDDLRRSMELHAGFQKAMTGAALCFAEVPSGAKDAKSARGLGIAVGILASSPVPIIQVQPLETKMASVGSKTATKKEVIAWATGLYPDAPWIRARGNPNGPLTLDNEHLADAVAVTHAGILTPEFRATIAILGATAKAA